MAWNVLIVDDERNMREGLKVLIDWEALDCHVSAVLKNGVEALNHCRAELVDIVLTDIQMPVMDGLELSRNLNEEFPDIIVIILSAYRNFEYAQSAIQYNVKRYLLKPVEENKLISCVKKAAAELSARNRGKDRMQDRRRELAAKLLFTYVAEEEREKLYNQAQELGMPLKEKLLTAVQIRLPNSFGGALEAFDYIEEYVWKNSRGAAGKDRGGSIALLLVRQEGEELCGGYNPKEFVSRLEEAFAGRYNWGFQAAVGNSVRDICWIERSYMCTNNLFLMGCFDESLVLEFGDLNVLEAGGGDAAAWNIEEFLQQVRYGQKEEALEMLGRLMGSLKKNSNIEITLYGYSNMIFQGLAGLNPAFDSEQAMGRVRQMNHILPIFEYLEAAAAETAECCIEGNADANTQMVDKIELLIKDRIGDQSLNIKNMAGELGYNAAYMGRVFGSVKGISIKEYISKKRMELACRLLKSTAESVADIAASVGYNDIGSFYDAFKRFKNLTPKEYRSR